MKKLLSLTTLLFLLTITINSASAQETECKTIYGGGLICSSNESLTLNKKILDPTSNNYVDNITGSVNKDQTINYQLTIDNKSEKNFKNFRVTDTFSSGITLITSNYKESLKDNTITFTVDSLNKNESIVISYTVRSNSDQMCLFNTAKLTLDKTNVADTAGICSSAKQTQDQSGTDNNSAQNTTIYGGGLNSNIDSSNNKQNNQSNTQTNNQTAPNNQNTQTKGGQTIYPTAQVKTSPDTGPGLVSLLSLVSAGITGFYLRNKIS